MRVALRKREREKTINFCFFLITWVWGMPMSLRCVQHYVDRIRNANNKRKSFAFLRNLFCYVVCLSSNSSAAVDDILVFYSFPLRLITSYYYIKRRKSNGAFARLLFLLLIWTLSCWTAKQQWYTQLLRFIIHTSQSFLSHSSLYAAFVCVYRYRRVSAPIDCDVAVCFSSLKIRMDEGWIERGRRRKVMK